MDKKRIETFVQMAGGNYVPKYEDSILFHVNDLQDFVELIVRECASLAQDGPIGILNHFGLKENLDQDA